MIRQYGHDSLVRKMIDKNMPLTAGMYQLLNWGHDRPLGAEEEDQIPLPLRDLQAWKDAQER